MYKYTDEDCDQYPRRKVQASRDGNEKRVMLLQRTSRKEGLDEDEKVELWRMVRRRYLKLETDDSGQMAKETWFNTKALLAIIKRIKDWTENHGGDPDVSTPTKKA